MIEASKDVKSSALLEFFTQAGSTHPVKATGIGLSEKLVYDIQNLTNREMMRLAKAYSNELVKVAIDVEKLEMLVSSIKYIESETNLSIEFIQRDASTPLLESLFGLGTFEVTAMRKALGISPSGGRPKCSIEERLTVLESWKNHSDKEERSRYLAVADETQISLKVIHMVLCQEKSEKLSGGEQQRPRPNKSA